MDFKSYLLAAFVAITPVAASAQDFVGRCTVHYFKAGAVTMHEFAINVLSTPHEGVAYVVQECMRADPDRPVPMEALGAAINSSAEAMNDFAKTTLENPDEIILNPIPAIE